MKTKTILSKIQETELDAIILIRNKMDCAMQAVKIGAIPEDPEINFKQIQAYYSAAINNLAEARFLEKSWWKDIFGKYNIENKKEVFIDFDTGELYFFEEK